MACAAIGMQQTFGVPLQTSSQRDTRATSEESFVVAKVANAKKLDVRPSLRAWGRFHLMNGLAIWKEGSGSSAAMHAASESPSSLCTPSGAGLDSYMVSMRIRGTPSQVVKSLLRLDGRGSCFWAFDTVSDVHELGSTDRAVMFKATMAPPVHSSIINAPHDGNCLCIVVVWCCYLSFCPSGC